MKIAVGLSGGVDSSVAAYLLKEQGHELVGVFMKNWDEDDGTSYCTAQRDAQDAQAVCDQLGIPLHCINLQQSIWDECFSCFHPRTRSRTYA